MSTAVWVGTPNDPGNTQALENIRLGGQYYSGIVGSSIAGSIWKATFDRALTGVAAVPFTEPSQGMTNGVKVAIPSVSRRSVDDAKQLLTQAGFLPRVVQIYSNARVGAVIGSSPSGTATRGSTVKILVSKGPDPTPPAPAPTAPPVGAGRAAGTTGSAPGLARELLPDEGGDG
ncbi:MAG: PASTA domain-containing protein [Dermatophilaceae bacterium]